MRSQEFSVQGIDALGVATLSSATSAAASRLPFAGGPSPLTSLDDEDVTNLRNLYRLLLLLSKVSQKENSSPIPGNNSAIEKVVAQMNFLFCCMK